MTTRQSGFTLLEALLGLTLMALALLISLSILWRLPRQIDHARAKQEAMRAIEATVDSLRSGALLLVEGSVENQPLPPEGIRAARDLRLWLRLTSEGRPGLQRVTVIVRYQVRGQTLTEELETLLWRP